MRTWLQATVWMAVALAGWARAQQAPNPEEFRAFGERIAQGEAVSEEEMGEMRKCFATNVIRPEHLDVGQNARYEIAEILLRRGDPRGAVARLREIVSTPGMADEVASVTRFNIAELLRVAMDEPDPAAQEFGQVKGNLEALAQREVLDLIERDPRKSATAVAVLEKRVTEAREKGERLALLTRLGQFYRRQKQDDKAIEVFQRIAQEATAEQIEAMRQQAVALVDTTVKEVRRLRQAEKWEEAEQLQQSLARRCNALHIQGRLDEAAAMQRRMERLEAEGHP